MRNKIQIIGGKYRSRKIAFPDNPELRPTPNRVRETLFNWLTPFIANARCLDLFAGSGVLGFEALSRGALSCTFVEKDRKTLATLRDNAKLLNVDSIEIIESEALAWLEKTKNTYDIVFLDPPYHAKLLPTCFTRLVECRCLLEGTLIYFESDESVMPGVIPKAWQLLREKKAGQVYYYLAKHITS